MLKYTTYNDESLAIINLQFIKQTSSNSPQITELEPKFKNVAAF